MTDIEELLRDTGARWRSAQVEVEPVIDLARLGPTRLSIRLFAGPIAAVVVVAVAAALMGQGWRFGGFGGLAPTLEPTAPGRAACAVTAPEPPFVPPAGYLQVPGVKIWSWYGTAALWTVLRNGGTEWSALPQAPGGLTQKLFWWSVDWEPAAELAPAITVEVRRLDGPGHAAFGPGTNASASDIGTAMLVGVELPSAGCWEITGTYRGAVLSYVVWVEPAAGPAAS